MKDRKKKVLGAAAGAAAAAAVGVAAAKIRGGKPTIYHVRQRNEGWAVEKEGGGDAIATHRTKRKAVKAGRDLAGGHRPSQLIIHRSDDSVQKEHSYTPDD